MTDDFKNRTQEAINLLTPISIYKPSDMHTITGEQMDLFREVIEDQQAEINRLKSSQVCLRPMSEAPLDGRMVVAYINKGEKSVRYKEYSQRDELSEKLGMTKTIGWIELSDLPTEIKHRDNAPEGCSWVTNVANKEIEGNG